VEFLFHFGSLKDYLLLFKHYEAKLKTTDSLEGFFIYIYIFSFFLSIIRIICALNTAIKS
jgi:hypothetical protein